jgi:hypothetical protein
MERGIVRSRALLALVLLAVAPAAASAQFTSYIAPQKKVDTAKPPTVAQAKATADSVTRASLTNMKAWVDSAAGIAAPVDSTAVTAAAPLDTSTVPALPRHQERIATTFRNGATAPATASELPMLALIGFAALSLGTVILAGRGRA